MRISDWSSDVCSSDLTCGISKAEGLEVLAGQWRVTRIAWQRAGISDIAPVIFPRANVPLDVFGQRQALLLPGANVDVIASANLDMDLAYVLAKDIVKRADRKSTRLNSSH